MEHGRRHNLLDSRGTLPRWRRIPDTVVDFAANRWAPVLAPHKRNPLSNLLGPLLGRSRGEGQRLPWTAMAGPLVVREVVDDREWAGTTHRGRIRE